MRFLIDNNLSPRVAAGLAEAGHYATHVRDHGLSAAPDEKVMAKAFTDRCVLIYADTDFGTLLAASGAVGPSVLLVRRISGRRPDRSHRSRESPGSDLRPRPWGCRRAG